MPLSPDQADQLLSAAVDRRVVVLGDVMLDAYVVGELNRISPEAPVPVLHVTEDRHTLGGAANAAKQAAALGCRVSLVGLVGEDGDADTVRRLADRLDIDTTHLIADAARCTTRKTRIVARQQQVIRVDRETAQPIAVEVERRLIAALEAALADADGLLIADYAKGAVPPAVARAAIVAANVRGIPSLVDPKHAPWDHFAGCTVLKPNRAETEAVIDAKVTDDTSAEAAAKELAERYDARAVLLTRGPHGMTLHVASQADAERSAASGNKQSSAHIPARLTADLADVTGCGDVVAATMLAAIAAGSESPNHQTPKSPNPAALNSAAELANLAAGVKATRFGAVAVTAPEVLAALDHAAPAAARKVMNRDQAAALAAEARAAGKRVVFTNGCFDILHAGHVHYLHASRALGDLLVLGLNTDASIQRLKGPTRPVQSEQDRARILASLADVDAVVLFDDDTPLELIRAVHPDVLTKGADYEKKENVVGWQDVESWGGRVELIYLVEGRSTTRVLDGLINDIE
ncbi:MAG: D-glycero-beta-D-manno-heptose 1-phosphate adenylyltransferase [Planctomycetota bacterium]